MLKTLLASVVAAGIATLPAMAFAQTAQPTAPATPVEVTQIAGFDAFTNTPVLGTLNGGFIIGVAAATVVILGTQSDSASGTR